MSNYPDGFGSRPSDWTDPRSPLYVEPPEEEPTLLEQAREMAEPPDTVDVEQQEPMLYLWQVEELLENL